MDFINVKWMKEIGCHPYSKVAKNNFWKGARGPHSSLDRELWRGCALLKSGNIN